MTTTPDAVEALVHSCEKYNYGKSASKEPRGESIIMSDIIEKHLASQGFTIARAEPAPVGFDAAIKQLGEPDEINHWSLDEGNLRWFVSQCRAEPSMSEAELEREARELSLYAGNNSDPDDMTIDVLSAIALAKKYRGQS